MFIFHTIILLLVFSSLLVSTNITVIPAFDLFGRSRSPNEATRLNVFVYKAVLDNDCQLLSLIPGKFEGGGGNATALVLVNWASLTKNGCLSSVQVHCLFT
jgi:hypothetical protein